jgi:guanine deaminase
MNERLALRGDLLDFVADPGWSPQAGPALRWRPDHWLLVEGGRVLGATPGPTEPGPDFRRVDHRGRLVLPGFIDTHVHSPQLGVLASFGTELLDWLNTYTFPAEQRFADPQVAADEAAHFLDALLAHGTTAAAAFPTVHRESAEALFEGAAQRGMRLITGKVMMDRHAPAALTDTVQQAERDGRELIRRWHGRGRLAHAVTLRFAPTSSPEQIRLASRLLEESGDGYFQTHVAENRDEVRWVAELFPGSRSYLGVYDDAGLLGERSILAHGIWLDDADRARLGDTGAQIAHSPTSNLFLGSGLMRWQAIEAAGGIVTLASDVGGGTSLSMLRTMAAAYQVQAMQGARLTAWKALHAATLGAARALRLEHEIGSFEPGRCADLCVWDWAVGPVAQRRDAVAGQPGRDLHERVFAWMTLGDERNLVETRVAGRVAFRGGAAAVPSAAQEAHP